MIKELDELDFKAFIASGVSMIDFWAAWCGPCRMQLSIVEQVASLMPDVKVAKINVDDNMNIAAKLNISSIPCIVIFKDGKIVTALMGLQQLPTLMAALQKAV